MKDDDFRKSYPGLTIIDPAGFLTHVRTAVGEDNTRSIGE